MSHLSSTLLLSIEKLNGKNWHSYSSAMKFWFIADGSWDIVNGTKSRPSDTAERPAWDSKASVSHSHIYFTIDPKFQHLITSLSNGPAAWKKLKDTFEKDTSSHRLALRTQLWHPRHDPSLDIMTYINSITSAADQLAAMKADHKPKDNEIADIILINLDESYSAVRTVLTSRSTEPTVEEIISVLQEEEGQRKLRDPDAESSGSMSAALAARTSSFGRPRFQASKQSDGPRLRWGNPTKGSGCNRCGASGHHSDACFADMPQWRKEAIISERASFADTDGLVSYNAEIHGEPLQI